MQLAKIARRNLNRNLVRTSIAVLAVTTVVVIVVFARGLMVGITESSFALYIDNFFGHVRITDEEYELREALLPLDYPVDGFNRGGAGEMIAAIEEVDNVKYVLPRIRFGAVAGIDDDLVRMTGVGIDPARENEYGALPEDIMSGRMPEQKNEILAGRGLLEKLGAEVDDRVTLVFSDTYQSLRGRTFEIVGVRETGISGLDDSFFYLPLETAEDMLFLEDAVTELLVFGPNAREAETLQAELNAFLAERGGSNYTTVIWNKADPFIEFYDEMFEIMDFVYLLFIIMGSVVIITTLTMIVRERTSEIGMMAALGLKGADIMRLFVLEGAFMGLIGSLLGVIAGGLITFHLSRAGLHAEAFAKVSGDLNLLIKPVFYPAFNIENLLISFALGVIVVTLSGFYPAYKAAKLDPMQALHYIDD